MIKIKKVWYDILLNKKGDDKMLKKSTLLILGLILSPSLLAEEKPSLLSVCESCHGVGLVSTIPGYPSLAGQDKTYVISSIKAYRDGLRTGGSSNLMIPISQMFTSDESIEEMATYINSLTK